MATFKVMTWNVENLFQPGGEFGPNTQQEYETKLASLAMVINQLQPDVLAIQEVGDTTSFDDLAARTQFSHKTLGQPDTRGIRVGFISKLPFKEAPVSIVDFIAEGLKDVPGISSTGQATTVTTMGRGALLVRVEPVNGFVISLFNLHLKSKLLSFPSTSGQSRFTPKDENERAKVAGLALLKRTAEAVTVRAAANKVLEGVSQPVIILGDFNDGPEAATTQIFKGPGGSEISTPRAFNTPDTGDDARLFNLSPLIQENRRYSRVYKQKGELIDHIFASVEFFPGNPRRVPHVDSVVDVFKQVAALSGLPLPDELPSLTDNPNERQGKPGSDHAPIVATFEI